MLSGNGLTFTRFIIAVNRTDMRLGIDGLSALIRLRYGMDPLEKGTLFFILWPKERQNKRARMDRRQIYHDIYTACRRKVSMAKN